MAVQTYTYPTLRVINEIDQQLLARREATSPIFRFFPIHQVPAHAVSWTQRDNYLGLQQIRGFNSRFPSVKRPAESEYIKQPSAFGEFTAINERELTERAIPNRPEIPVPIDDLVLAADEMLLNRQFNRQEWLLWQLIVYGTYVILNDSGTVMEVEAYSPQTYTPSTPWTTAATSSCSWRLNP